MTKIETLKISAEALLGSENQMISGEEYLELLSSAKTFAENEFEKFRIEQDKKYISDFDKIIADYRLNNKKFS